MSAAPAGSTLCLVMNEVVFSSSSLTQMCAGGSALCPDLPFAPPPLSCDGVGSAMLSIDLTAGLASVALDAASDAAVSGYQWRIAAVDPDAQYLHPVEYSKASPPISVPEGFQVTLDGNMAVGFSPTGAALPIGTAMSLVAAAVDMS